MEEDINVLNFRGILLNSLRKVRKKTKVFFSFFSNEKKNS